MAFQAIPDTASVRIITNVFSGAAEFVNTLYCRDTIDSWSTGKLAALAVEVGNAWRDEVMPLLNPTAILDRVEARDETTEFGVLQIAEYNTAGGSAGNALSGAMCMYAKISGDSGAPPREGGLFISPFSEDDIAGDVWDATQAGLLQTAIQDVIAAMSATDITQAAVLVSRYSKAAVPVAPHKRTVAETNTIAGVEVSQRLAIQRDRRVGQGS